MPSTQHTSGMRQVLTKDCGAGVSQKGRQDQALGAGASLLFSPQPWSRVVGAVTSAADSVSEDRPLGMKDRSFLLFLMMCHSFTLPSQHLKS